MSSPGESHTEHASTGTVAPGFEAVKEQLDAYLHDEPLYSAQLAVYWRGELVVDVVGGTDMTADSLTGVFSVSKGAGAAAISLLVESGELDLEQRVAHYWPEFAQSGKDEVLVRQLLSHQAGLLGVDERLALEDFLDSRLAAGRLARERPLWRPGSAFGYHGLTIGVFMEELVRRITGDSLQELYERQIRGPRDIDFFLGLPGSEDERYRDVLPMAPTEEQAAELAARTPQPDGMAMLMFNSSGGTAGADISPNQRTVRAVGPSAFGAVASGRGLAKLYAALLGEVGDPFLSADTNQRMSQQQSWGIDRCFGDEHCFGTVYQRPSHRVPFGSHRAFGHDGAGGGLGFADPLHDLAFGYIPARMAFPGGVDPKAVKLSTIARAAASAVSADS